jgi:hypothetical protein
MQTPYPTTVTEPEVVEGLVCDTSVSEFNSRQSPQMEAAAEGQQPASKTGVQ